MARRCFCFFFSSFLLLFLANLFFPFSILARHQHTCAAPGFSSQSPSCFPPPPPKFIYLPLIAASHCHYTKRLTVDGEGLFFPNRDSRSSLPSLWCGFTSWSAVGPVGSWDSVAHRALTYRVESIFVLGGLRWEGLGNGSLGKTALTCV